MQPTYSLNQNVSSRTSISIMGIYIDENGIKKHAVLEYLVNLRRITTGNDPDEIYLRNALVAYEMCLRRPSDDNHETILRRIVAAFGLDAEHPPILIVEPSWLWQELKGRQGLLSSLQRLQAYFLEQNKTENYNKAKEFEARVLEMDEDDDFGPISEEIRAAYCYRVTGDRIHRP